MGKLDLEAAASLPTMMEEEGDQDEVVTAIGQDTETGSPEPDNMGDEGDAEGGTEQVEVRNSKIRVVTNRFCFYLSKNRSRS